MTINFLRRAAIAFVAAAAAFTATHAEARAKYVFYFIGDGMGMGHVNTTETYRRDVLRNGTDPLLMLTFPVAAQVRTFSANHPITDSAAAGTALATGSKTRNGMVGMAADSTDVESVAARFAAAGYGVGVASSVPGDDATPASFYAHAPHRSMSDVIAPMAASAGYAFFGAPVWRGMKKADGTPSGWEDTMRRAGYSVYRGYEAYAADTTLRPRRLLLSANPQGEQAGFTIDSIPGALTLPQLTQACLSQLKRVSPDGFFMMVEGGNIDWAAHANDGGAVVKEILNFQEAIDVAYRFYLTHPDETLIVVTADHDTGGMALGREDNQKGIRLDAIDFQRISKDRFSEWCKARMADNKKIDWKEMQSFLRQNFGLYDALTPSEADDQRLRRAFEATFVTRSAKDSHSLYADYNAFATTVLDVFNRMLGIGWTTGYHTGNFVPLYAVGAGADTLHRCLNNTDIAPAILRAAEIKPSAR